MSRLRNLGHKHRIDYYWSYVKMKMQGFKKSLPESKEEMPKCVIVDIEDYLIKEE